MTETKPKYKRAVLINVDVRDISEVYINDGIQEMYRAIGCDVFTAVTLTRWHGTRYPRETLYVDDNGLSSNKPFFLIDSYPQPLAGNGLVLSTDEAGESISTELSVDCLRRKVSFATRVALIEAMRQGIPEDDIPALRAAVAEFDEQARG